jgi:transposase
MPKRYPPEFRRKVLDLVAAGRPDAKVAAEPRHQRSDHLHLAPPRLHRHQPAARTDQQRQRELVAARRRIAQLEAELSIHRRAAELLKDTSGPKSATRRGLPRL